MIPKEIEDKLVVIARQFTVIHKIYLFGSRAYGDNQERSDIDLAIVAPDMSDKDWLFLSEKIEEDLDTLLKFDLVHWEKASSKLQEEIMKCHKVIYSA